MASITITIPNNQLTRVLNGVCGYHGYEATIHGSPNPETQAQFAQRKLREEAIRWIAAYEAQVAGEAASVAVGTEVTLS